MTSNKILFILAALLVVHPVESFLAPSHQIKCITTQLSSSMPHLYRDEPNPLDAAYIKKEEHEPKHSSFHVERGIEVDAVSLMAVLMMIFAAVLFGAGFSA